MTKKVLVTGLNGFVGKHLVRELAKSGCKIGGISREPDVSPEIKDLVDEYIVCDLADSNEVNKLDLSSYDAFISLAGLANVGQSFDQSDLYQKVNVAVLTNICQRLVDQSSKARVIAVSTGAVYDGEQALPLKEDSELIINGSPYALSKIAMEKSLDSFRKNKQIECIVVRPFNHIGPGQGQGFLVPDMYHRMVEAVAGNGVLRSGNLHTRRDYTDVRDVVRAYVLLATAETDLLTQPIYNVCSGVSRSGEEIVDELRRLIPGADKIEVLVDPSLVRPNDPLEHLGDNSHLINDTGWKPQIPFEQTIADFVKYSSL